MENKRKSFTLRVSPELKFQIEKAATEEGFTTINSWIIHVIVQNREVQLCTSLKFMLYLE